MKVWGLIERGVYANYWVRREGLTREGDSIEEEAK